MSTNPTIIEFLEARIAEDEQLAELAAVSMHGERHENQRHYGSYILSSERDSTEAQDEFILEWWPARVLAECAAKRAIIDEYTGSPATFQIVAHMAAVYSNRPDYQQEWVL